MDIYHTSPRPYKDIFGAFSALENWALLRNSDVIANFERGGDCDLLVSDLTGASQILRDFLGEPLRIARRSYVVNFFYPWGHIDLCLDLRWHGVVLRAGKDLLSRSSVHQDWPVISEADEAGCLLLNSLLWGGFVKERYLETIAGVSERQPEEMKLVFTEMLGRPAARLVWDCVQAGNWNRLGNAVQRIRIQTLLWGLQRRPLATLKGYVHFIWCELMIRLQPGLPMLVAHIPRDADVSKIEDNLKHATAVYEYKLLLKRAPDSKLKWWLERLALRSFRAKNGLVVFWKEADRSVEAIEECICMEVEDVSAAGVLKMIREFQRCAAGHEK